MSEVMCSHLDEVTVRELPAAVDGCEDCLREGGKWLHLRICLSCGHIGCCDDSPNRHATATNHATAHPTIPPLNPREAWTGCNSTKLAFFPEALPATTRSPPSRLLIKR